MGNIPDKSCTENQNSSQYENMMYISLITCHSKTSLLQIALTGGTRVHVLYLEQKTAARKRTACLKLANVVSVTGVTDTGEKKISMPPNKCTELL
jgi:hypothetical protein